MAFSCDAFGSLRLDNVQGDHWELAVDIARIARRKEGERVISCRSFG